MGSFYALLVPNMAYNLRQLRPLMGVIFNSDHFELEMVLHGVGSKYVKARHLDSGARLVHQCVIEYKYPKESLNILPLSELSMRTHQLPI